MSNYCLVYDLKLKLRKIIKKISKEKGISNFKYHANVNLTHNFYLKEDP